MLISDANRRQFLFSGAPPSKDTAEANIPSSSNQASSGTEMPILEAREKMLRNRAEQFKIHHRFVHDTIRHTSDSLSESKAKNIALQIASEILNSIEVTIPRSAINIEREWSCSWIDTFMNSPKYRLLSTGVINAPSAGANKPGEYSPANWNANWDLLPTPNEYKFIDLKSYDEAGRLFEVAKLAMDKIANKTHGLLSLT